MITAKNSFRKLYDGSWAIVVCDGSQSGATVTVTMRDGSTKQATLGEQLPGVDAMMQAPLFKVAAKAAEAKATVNVGNLSGLLAMFDKARAHLQYPAIVLSVPAINETIKINVAGERARVPGSLNVVSQTRSDDRGGNLWYGRVLRDGNFEQRGTVHQAISKRLMELADDPVRVAGEHGRLTGSCCFCNKTLTDERSTAVGYGPICAGHYGLPWGETMPHGDHEDDDERVMKEIEARGDREQTIRDEFNKLARRRRMENAPLAKRSRRMQA